MLDSLQHISTDSLVIINAQGVELPNIERATNWATSPLIGITLIVLFLLFVVALNQGKHFYIELLRNYFRDRDRITYEEADNTTISILFMLIISIITGSIFITITATPTHTLDFSNTTLIFLIATLTVVIIWLLTHWLLFKYVGYISNLTASMRKLTRSFFTTFIAIGLLLFPIVVGMIYAPPTSLIILIYIGYGVILMGVLLILFKAFQFFFTGLTSLCYLFLYLCTLEILPLLLIKKAVVMWFANV